MRISQTEEMMEAYRADSVPADAEQTNDSTQSFVTQLTEVLTLICQEKNAGLEKYCVSGKPSEEMQQAIEKLIEAFPLTEAAKAAGVDKAEAIIAMLEWIDTAHSLAADD